MIDPGTTLMRVLNTRPPQRLFHYTSLAGLDGIAKSNALWASAAQYMNDAQEFRLALDIARRHLDGAAHRAKSPGRVIVIEYLRDQVRRAEELEVCLFSLSQEGDLLSQWRGYCPPNGGYSVGFEGQPLREIVAPQGAFLAPCVYDIDVHEVLVRDALKPLLERVPESPQGSEQELTKLGEEFAGLLFEQIVFIAPLIKHPSFLEEREWRLIWIPGRTTTLPLRYRVGPGTYIPYVAISLTHEDAAVPLAEIIVGPMPHQQAAMRALSGAMHGRGNRPKVMRYSQVPYRTW
jgi:hypothetical protein